MEKGNKRKLSLSDIIRKMNEGPVSQDNRTGQKTHSTQKTASKDRPIKQAAPKNDLPIQPAVEKKLYRPISGSSHAEAVNSSQTKTETDTAESKEESVSPPVTPSPAPGMPPPHSPSMNQTLDGDNDEEFDLFRYLGIIIRRKEIIILTTIVMGLISLFSYLKGTKYFMASARLLFRPNQQSIIDDKTSWRVYADRDRNFSTHLELLKSNIVLERVANNLGGSIMPGNIAGGLIIAPGEISGEETNIIELMYKNSDAEMARDILNELCKSYIEYRREVNAQEDTRLILKLKVQIDKIQNELTTRENALREFKEKHRMVHLSQDANLIVSKLTNMEIALQETQLGLLENKERLVTLKSQISKQEINIVQSKTYENPIRSRLADLELELNTLSGEYSPDHFKIKQITQQIENLKKVMQSEIEKEVTDNAVKHILVKNPIRESLLQTFVNHNIEISALEAKRIAQEQIIERLKIQMQKLPSLEQEFAYLQRETESLLKTLKMLKIKLEQTKIRRDSKESELKILELAKLPELAISNKKFSSIFIGVFIGLIIGIALIFLLEYLDQSLKDPTDVEKILELPLIGIVPFDQRQVSQFTDDIPGIIGNTTRFFISG